MIVGVIGILIVVCLITLAWYLNKAMPIVTGFIAKYLCSNTFISQHDPKVDFEEEIKPINILAHIVTWQIDWDQKSVVTRALGKQSKAIYREGHGSILVSGVTEQQLTSQAFFRSKKMVRPALDLDSAWPLGGAPCVAPETRGYSAKVINQALDYAFSEPSSGPQRNTNAVLIACDGQLIGERYARGCSASTPLLGWSITKSVINALVGILVEKKLLDIHAPAPVPQWQAQEDPRQAITVDQLLRMSSGLKFSEVYKPLRDVTEMLFFSADFAAYAASKPLTCAPDTQWSYSSGSTNIICRIIHQLAAQLYTDHDEFMRRELFDRIGMTTAFIEKDPSGNFVGSSYGFACARDWARFGQLYLQDGIWNGERILPEGWVNYSATPTRHAPLGEYGAHFWLNAGMANGPNTKKWPNAPRDMLVAQGHQDQRIIIIPSKKLVVVRMGASQAQDAWDLDSFLTRLLV